MMGSSQGRAGGFLRGRLGCRELHPSAPLKLTSLVTFLFSDKKVTTPLLAKQEKYRYFPQKTLTIIRERFFLQSFHGAGFILRHQQIGNDGVADQITLGGQNPTAFVIDAGVA